MSLPRLLQDFKSSLLLLPRGNSVWVSQSIHLSYLDGCAVLLDLLDSPLDFSPIAFPFTLICGPRKEIYLMGRVWIRFRFLNVPS